MDHNDWNLLWRMLEAYRDVYPSLQKVQYDDYTAHLIKTDINPWIEYAKKQEEELLKEDHLKMLNQMIGRETYVLQGGKFILKGEL